MDRRPRRWNPGSGGSGGPPSSHAGRGGLRSEHLIVTCIIIGAVLAIGLCMPAVWFESVLAWIGFR